MQVVQDSVQSQAASGNRSYAAGRANAPMFKAYLRFIANRRCRQIGLGALYPGAGNPFPWMSEMIDLKKERNFFETRVIEYQTGGALNWD
jgi:ribonucleoside-diphosphate reductase beta chain